jgi:hypothetical protein
MHGPRNKITSFVLYLITEAQPNSENIYGFIKIEKVEEKPVLATLYAASSNPSSSQRISGGWRQQGIYMELKIEKTACFSVGESFDVTRAHSLTSSPLPRHLRMICVDNVFLSSFDHALPKF